MNSDAFLKFYGAALQTKEDEAPPHSLKGQPYLCINPIDMWHQTLDKFSFDNQNLGLIIFPSDSYLYLELGIKTAVGVGGADADIDADVNMVFEKVPSVVDTTAISLSSFVKWQTQKMDTGRQFQFGQALAS